MVAVITGNGLGLGNTSLTPLGQAQGGSPSLGQAANSSYVNSATGNLVLQSADEGLVYDGLSLNALLTYNSLGQLSSNGWSYGFSRNVNSLTGTLDSAGSTITRTGDDGASVVYTYNTALGAYVSTDQSGAVDTLSWNATASTWTWTDAADNSQETYNASGQLTALTDTATGASYRFSYSNGQLSQIVAGDGDTLLFGYNTNNQLISLSIQDVPPGQTTAITLQLVSYGYDSQGRLSTVTTTLASDTDSSTASYTTTYTYQGTTDLIASVTQSDGTTVSYTYTQDAQGAYQVTGVTTGTGSAAQSVTLSYGTGSTTVTDGLGNATQYQYNAAGDLTAVIAPAVNGVSPTTTYTYDANGNLLTSTDPDGAVTSYSYDANGNLLSVEDGAGNTVSYTYNANDQLTSKTTYTVPAQGEVGQSGYVAPTGAQTTYYVYTATNQLAYTVDPLGNVSENTYTTINGLSELTTRQQYLGATYSTSSNSPANPPTLAELQAWVQSSAVQSTLSQSTRIDYSYDLRGQLATQTQYDTVDANGNGVLDAGTVVTTTTYSAQGQLLQTSTETGADRSTLQTTSYAYDGLGRLISTTDPLGNVTSYVYTDNGSNDTLAITQANGLTTTQVRNSAGVLVSSTQSASGQASRVTSDLYNADGEAIAAIDPLGNVTYTFYNADGEVTGTVDGDGNVTAYTYDADGRVLSTTQYATQINPSSWYSDGALTSSYPSSLPIPASTANDRTTTSIYNAAGQVVATIDPAGNVTTTTYDGAGDVLSTTQYATPLTTALRNALGSTPTLTALQADLSASRSNRTTLTIYDADGQAVATLDAAGYVTTTTYNAAGEAVLTTAYATALTGSQVSSLGDTPTLAALQADLTTSAQDQTTRTYYDGDGRVVAQIDADGYLTTTAYDTTTDTTTTTRYATALTSAQLTALTGTESVATLVGLLGSNTTNEQSRVTTNADGEVASRTAVDGTVTTYTYNAAGQVLSTTVTPTSGQGAARTTRATYDAFGDELTSADATGATTTYVYNALGEQIEATDADGNSTWSYYDADGKRLYTIQGQPSGSTLNALGDVTAYTYNAFGDVSSTTTYAAPLTLTTGASSGSTLNPTGATAAQVATAIAALGTVSGDANATTRTTYTLDGQVATTTDGDGYVTADSYDAFGDVIQTQQQLSQPGSALTSSNSTLTTYTYDDRGEQLSETDAVGTSVARTTSATYDAFGRITSRTDGNGNTITYSYDTLGRQVSTSQTVQGTARTTQTTYDAFGNVLTQTDALGNTTTYGYDIATHTTTVTTPDGVTMTTVKDAYGDTVSVTDGGGTTTTYTYDADGRLLTTTTPLGEVSTNQYDADGDLIQSTDATGHGVTTTYNASGQVLTQTVDPNGLNLTTSYAYDAQGRTLSVTDPTGAVTTYSYDADGNRLTVTNAVGSVTSYSYDGEGKTLTVTVGAGTNAAVTTQYVYDNLERLSQTIVDPGSLALTTTYRYDADNNLTSVTDANGNVTQYVYDQANEKIVTIDPTGAVTQNWYDADGHLSATRTYATVLTASQLSALGSTPTIAAVTADLTASDTDSYTQSAYNADGQVIYTLSGTALNVTQYTYNRAGQVTQTRQYATALSSTTVSPTATPAAIASLVTASANDLVTTTVYNADGEAVYTINGDGAVTQTTYDAAGRVTKTTAYATALTATQLASLGSTPTTAQVAALLTPSTHDRSTYTSYDNAGRIVDTINAAGAVTQTTYDADGRVTSTHAYATALTSAQLASLGSTPSPAQISALVTASSADQVSYNVYDSAGELRYTINPLGDVTETRYNAAGQVIETLAYANAVSTASETPALQAGTALGWLSTTVGGTGGSNPDSSAEATLYLYDAAGRRVFTVQQNDGGTVGQVSQQVYDANGNVTRQIVYGSTLTLSPSASLSAQLTTASVTSAVAAFTNQETTTTVYDGDNRAIYTINALNDVTQTTYDAFGHVLETQQYATPILLPGTITASTIAAAVTAAGTSGARISTFTYDSRGDVTATGDALGTNASYTYNALGQKTSYTDADGNTWTYTYDAAGRLLQTQSPPVTVGSYTGSGLQTATSQYLYTTTTYDAFGDVVSTRQGYGTSASAITNASTTSTTYDALGQPIATTNALGDTRTTTYNTLGQAVVSQDANGNLTYSVYNAAGQLIDSVDGNGDVTAYTYDAYGNVLTTTQYATALDTGAITGWSVGQPLSAAQLQQGLVTSSSDRTTTTTYNQLNQKTAVVLPSISYDLSMGALAGSPTTGSPTTTTTYDAYGNVTSTSQLVQGALTVGSTTSPAIWETTYTYYDALNRAVMVVTPTGSYASPQGYVTTTAYNAFNQVITSTQYAQAISTSGITTTTPPGLPAAATQASGANRVTSYTYDAIGRVASETQTGGYSSTTGYTTANNATSYTYNGDNQVLTETVNGATTTTTYDALGRVLSVTAPAREALVSDWQAVLEANPSDSLGNTSSALYVSVSPVTSYVYDALGDAVSTTVSGGGLTQQSYATFNALGQQTESVDADGNVSTTTYDANGNVLTQSYTLTPGVTVTTTHTYDADNQLLSTAVKRSNASTDDSYTQQKYNAFGEVIAKGDNNGYETTYTYNNAGQQTSAPNSSTGAIHTYGYDLVGNLVLDTRTVTGGSATVSTQNTYNLSNQVITQLTPSTDAATGENTAAVSTRYDRWGNVLAETDANGNTTTYQYDSQNHLIEETQANVLVVSATGVYAWTTPTETWDYNVNGELTQSKDANGNVTTYSYDAAGNQTVVEDGTGAFTYTGYDALGRAVATQTPPVQEATTTACNVSYTTYNNLNQVTGQGDFQYNAAGDYVTMSQGTYVLNANGDRIQSTDALGNTTTYTYDSQHHVLTSTTPMGDTTTYVYDVNGNLIKETDPDGNTPQTWVYNYFGQVLTHTDESGATYTYTYDANSGLMTGETSNWTATGPSASPTSTLTYSYDAGGQLAGLTEVVGTGSSAVTSTYGYGYDANGNETLETVSTKDGGGGLVDTQTLITYDSHNRVQEATDENATGTVATMRSVYVYDADGNRRAVFTSSAYDSDGVAATPIPLTPGTPTASTLATQTIQPGNSVSYTIPSGSFTDPLGMGLTYTVSGLPSWLSFNASTQTFTGTPPKSPGTYTVTVTATDVLGRSASSILTITVPTAAPVFSSGPSSHTLEYTAFSFTQPAATSANGLPVTYSATYNGGALPSWMTFNASTLTFSGTPPVGSAGSYTIALKATVTGTTTQSTTENFTVTVAAISAPTFTSGASNQSVLAGKSFSFTVPSATDSNGLAINYSASGMPSWMSFNASTLTFSGTVPAMSGSESYSISVSAVGAGTTDAATNSFTFYANVTAPTFTAAAANQTVTSAEAFSFTVPSATDANGYGITYTATYNGGALPSWITFNASTLTFSGTPPAGNSASYSLAVIATANGTTESTSNAFTLTTTLPAAPSYSGPTSMTGECPTSTESITQSWSSVFHGTGLTYQVNYSGVTGIGNGWSTLTASVNSSGTLSITALCGEWPPIEGTLKIVATDIEGRTVTASISLTIYPSTGANPPSGGPGADALAATSLAGTSSSTAPTPTPSLIQATSATTPTPTPAPSPTPNVQADWFTYDADNRVLIADGSLQNSQIIINDTNTNSGENVYDAAGDVIQYTTVNSSNQQTVQDNYYDTLGQLTMVQSTAPGGTTFGEYESLSYNDDGQLVGDVFYNLPGHEGAGTYNGSTVTFSDVGWVSTATFYTYNADGELIDQSQYAEEAAQNLINTYGTGVASSTYATQDKEVPTAPSTPGANTDGALYLVTDNSYAASSGYGYDADGNLLGYHTTTTSNATVVNAAPTASVEGYQNSYIEQNGLLLSTTTQVPTSGSSTVTTSNTYNDLGELASSTGTANGAAQIQAMAYTAGGQLLQKSSTSSGTTTTTTYESVDENELGSVNTAGIIDVLSTTGGYSNSSTGTQNYTVQAGDTLQSLAQAIYGDSNYYYIIAQANGLSPTATLTAGMVLKIPQVTTSANASSTYQPYAQSALLSAGATALYTTAQIVAMSIDAVLGQQSAIAQTVAQVEAQAQQAAAEQAQAAEAQQLAAEQSQQAKQAAAQAAQAAQQAAAAAQAAQQALDASAQAAQAAQQIQAQATDLVEKAAQAAQPVVVDTVGSPNGIAGWPEWGSLSGANYGPSGDPMDNGASSVVDDDGAVNTTYSSFYNTIVASGGIFNYMAGDSSGDGSGGSDTDSSNDGAQSSSDSDLSSVLSDILSDADGSDSSLDPLVDNLSGLNSQFESDDTQSSLFEAQYASYQSQSSSFDAEVAADQSLVGQAQALAQQDLNTSAQDSTLVQQAQMQEAQLDTQLGDESNAGGGLTSMSSNVDVSGDVTIQPTSFGSGLSPISTSNDFPSDQQVANIIATSPSYAYTDTSSNLGSPLGPSTASTDNTSVYANDGASNDVSAPSGWSGLQISTPIFNGDGQSLLDPSLANSSGGVSDPLLASAEQYNSSGGSVYDLLNAANLTPVSFALGAYQGVQAGGAGLENQLAALPGEISNEVQALPAQVAQGYNGLLNSLFTQSGQQQLGQAVNSLLNFNVGEAIGNTLTGWVNSAANYFQTATPQQMGYDLGYNATINAPTIAMSLALDGGPEVLDGALAFAADDGKGINIANSLIADGGPDIAETTEQSVDDLFGQTINGPNVSHTAGLQNGVLGEDLGLQTLNQKTNLNFEPLQNNSGNGADGIAIDDANQTVWVAEVKSSQNGVDAAANATGDPVAKLNNWINASQDPSSSPAWSSQPASNQALIGQIQEAIDAGYEVRGVQVQVGVPTPGTTGATQIRISPWTSN